MKQENTVITEEEAHPNAVALLKDYRLIYTGAKFTQDELVALVEREQPVAVLSRHGTIDEQVQTVSKKLGVIGRHGVGMDSINKVAAKRLGIRAIAATGSNSEAVAELALGLILPCARRMTRLDKRMHGGHGTNRPTWASNFPARRLEWSDAALSAAGWSQLMMKP
ncbi:hypothetical protein [Variovorax rhizosphaerae]|uniref:D-isomer specific 2-hydroxyacid dehydrogenase catalytic domain-containing protein n=1 Tax=Variovorax rhizosphaerae TaxID=1836200 RepID=A0ABU8WRB0_9BURK